MKYFLAKTEPTTYSIDDLQRDKRTVWDGVTNATAVRNIREMKAGDRVFIYHSGGVSAIVGLAKIIADGRTDPKNPKSAVAEFEYIAHLDPAVALHEIKQSKKFDDWALVRQSRLSTMPCPPEFVSWMKAKYAKGVVE